MMQLNLNQRGQVTQHCDSPTFLQLSLVTSVREAETRQSASTESLDQLSEV